MTLIQLRSLCAVADEGSFTRAAEVMFVTQPALSMQIKKLEDEIGEPLLDRSGSRVSLTGAGEVLSSRARNILAELDDALQEVTRLSGLDHGTLSIASSDTIAEYFLLPFLQEFAHRYPGIRIVLVNRPTVQIEELLVDNRVEIGLVTLPVSLPQLSSRTLFSYRQLAVCSPDSPFAGQKRLSARQLVADRVLALPNGTRSRMLLERDLARAEAEAHNVMELGSVHLLKAFARIGFGVATVPEYAVSSDDLEAGLVSIPVSDLSEREIGIVHRERRRLSEAAKAFEAMVVGSLAST